MTSVQTMQVHSRQPWLLPLVLLLFGCMLSGCDRRFALQEPGMLSAPYPDVRVWAVVPFANESGTNLVDGVFTADIFTSQLEQVSGIQTIPVNRVINAMKAIGLSEVNTPAEALALMNTLRVDGLLVGTVTAYDGFPPFTLGIAVELHSRDVMDPSGTIDPRDLIRTIAGEPAASTPRTVAVQQASGVFDVSNHQVRRWLSEYTTGRTVPDSAFGDRIYERNMDLYTEFVSYRIVGSLLLNEHQRLARVQDTTVDSAR